MSILSWPLTERPRERLLQQGAKALSDAELLAKHGGTSLFVQDARSNASKIIVVI